MKESRCSKTPSKGTKNDTVASWQTSRTTCMVVCVGLTSILIFVELPHLSDSWNVIDHAASQIAFLQLNRASEITAIRCLNDT